MSTTSKAMTLQEAKDQVAKKYGSKDWDSIDFYWENQAMEENGVHGDAKELFTNEAAELYSSSQSAALKDKTIEEAKQTVKEYFAYLRIIDLEEDDIIERLERLKIDLKG